MQELRNLFALMVATQRKYVDPTRAVDILRGSIGNNNQMNNGNNTAGKLIVVNLSNLPAKEGGFRKMIVFSTFWAGDLANALVSNASTMLDNNQQDVSEFTHIVLEWVEEAFKRNPSNKDNMESKQ